MASTAETSRVMRTGASVRERIPGWGIDRDPKDRPSYPRERFDLEATGAHWNEPEHQAERQPRERSIEHAGLTPVFGTAQPLKGLSGVMRQAAYAKYSEARAAHWLMLIAADRVDAWEEHLRSMLTLRPDNPITETGVRAERRFDGPRARMGQGRTDVRHQVMDPLIVAGPWLVSGALAYLAGRTVIRSLRRSWA